MTELADFAVRSAVHFLINGLALSGKLTPADRAHPEIGAGYFVLAMGKMGAFELNYSSDIDLIVFFDPDAAALAADIEPGPLFVRLTQNLVRLLQERTPDGYVFRVDLRLRPDPASTPIAISTPAALEYYERRGQNWERSAMIKARVCAGDISAGEKFLKSLAPFVWRKFMDYAALADIHAMKRQIHAYKGHGEIAVAGHNVKLGRGGIREIEFFAQTQQLIAGGRHPILRDRGTLETMHSLANDGWISAEAEHDLRTAYHFLRKIEHRLQMVADEQTHVLPSDRGNLQRFARFLGFKDEAAFAESLLSHLGKVQRHYSKLFEHAPATLGERPLAFPKDFDDRETLDRISALGFRNPLQVSALVRNWLAGPYPALKSEFARGQLAELAPLLLEQISRAESREAGLASFDRFLAGLHSTGGGRLFSLLKQNPDLLALISSIVGSAPRLADTLAHHPQVIDALTDPTFFGALPDAAMLAQELSRSLDQKTSYEDFLDRLRIFAQEQMFLAGGRILSGTVSAEQAGEAFARIADTVIRALHTAVEARFAESYGRIAGQRTALLALGKLGGREMTATSDLDLILVYDFDEEHPESDGRAKLYGGQYFARLTQHLISALTVPTNYGALYQVDMRLRPSGRSGPVATQIRAFQSYQESEAWTWEHMALTRARVVSATPGFGEEVALVIREVLRGRRDPHMITREAFEMRQTIAREKGEADRWDLKYAAGGLIDVEFVAQLLQLIHAADHPDILHMST
ncbi:MAG: bifunctional [glutamine synthetase] adenylyltransferase/[glutamine synthetase]-adenylyl-L-tyrosine phosphorylase, partial [Pseudomonadota bacterium]|nr:bifunctional [glutamine synthetase] adenylyltransferase/[glutamine synthetase]-adenylyl-L-tyrosine phosphorylase [Pseudomonadota bacterium]